jgi:hypothetical protein
MMMEFSEFGVLLFIEDFDCIILQSIRQVQYSLLWESFIKWFAKVLNLNILQSKTKCFQNPNTPALCGGHWNHGMIVDGGGSSALGMNK